MFVIDAVFVRTHVVGQVDSAGPLVVVDSALDGHLIVRDGAGVGVYHSIVASTANAPAATVSQNSALTLVDTDVVAHGGFGPLLQFDATSTYALHGVLFDAAGVDLTTNAADDDAGLATIAACNDGACTGADHLVRGRADLLAGDFFHLDPAATNAPAVGAGVNAIALGAPNAALVDVDGQCRAGSSPNIGPDQR